MELVILIIAFVAIFMFMSSRGRKRQEEHLRQMQNEIETGTWVRTTAGYYGMISDIDGDVYILQSPGGDETYWDKRAIAMVTEPPFAVDDSDIDSDYPDVETATDQDWDVSSPDEPASLHAGGEPLHAEGEPLDAEVADHPDLPAFEDVQTDLNQSDEPTFDSMDDFESHNPNTLEQDANADILEPESNDGEDLWDDSFTSGNDSAGKDSDR